MAETLTELGGLLEAARQRAGLSVRAAARAAGFSEGTWRQIVLGYRQVTADVRVPTNPKVSTVRAAAEAVGADVARALELAGHEREAEQIRATVGPAGQGTTFVAAPEPGVPIGEDTARELLEEIRQVRREVAEIKKKLDGS